MRAATVTFNPKFALATLLSFYNLFQNVKRFFLIISETSLFQFIATLLTRLVVVHLRLTVHAVVHSANGAKEIS